MQTTPEELQNPFLENSPADPDEELVAGAKAGGRDQLGLLLSRHLP